MFSRVLNTSLPWKVISGFVELCLVDNFTQWFMLSAHMRNKTSLSKPLFQEILQFCNAIVILQIIVKKPFKHLLKVSRFYKFVVFKNKCFRLLSLSLCKLWATNYQKRETVTLKHLLKLIKQTSQGVYMNIFCFYIEKNR